MATHARQQYFADESSLSKERREFSIADEIQEKIDSIEEGAQVNVIETVKVNGTALVPDVNKAINVEVPEVIDNLYTIDSDNALSAKQGKLLYDYIQNIASRGRFLSNWNSATGLPMTNPSESPYPYKSGDYFVVSNVAGLGGTNYRPDGSSYIIGQASTVIETEGVDVSDFYFYDGTTWLLLKNSSRSWAVDSSLSTTSTNPVENRVITNALNGKQDTLIAGTNIQIASDGKTISATDTTYTAGTNIQISNQNVISATDTVYTAGTGINIDANNVISNTQTSAEWGNITGTLSNQTDLQNALNNKANRIDVLEKTNTTSYTPSADYNPATKKYVDDTASGKQDSLTASANINITSNVIKATNSFQITSDNVTVTTTETPGVAPYNTSYKYTNYEIAESSGIEWVEGAIYSIVATDAMQPDSNHRNLRIRIGSTGDWKPVMQWNNNIYNGNGLSKNVTRLFVYKTTNQPTGALHMLSDDNTTYGQLGPSVSAGAFVVDNDGFCGRNTMIFPTTPIGVTEKWSSLCGAYASGVWNSTTAATKVAITPTSGKFYIDREPLFLPTNSYTAGQTLETDPYQYYFGYDMRYSTNIANNTYVSPSQKVFLWLKNFDISDYSFVPEVSEGIVTIDKLATRFSGESGDIYLFHLGWSGPTYYQLRWNLDFQNALYKYNVGTGTLESMRILTDKEARNAVKSVNGNTGAVTVEEFNATNGGTKLFAFPDVSDDISDLVTWLTNGGSAIIGDEYGYCLVTSIDTSGREIKAECPVILGYKRTWTIAYNASKVVTSETYTDDYYFNPGGTATTGYVVTKTANGYEWQAPSGGIENVTSGTTTAVTGIRAGTEAEYGQISTPSASVLYFTF